MPDVFSTEGGGAAKKPDDGKKPKKKPVSRGEPDMLYGSMDPRAGEGVKHEFSQYDNESGAIMVNLPPKMAKYKRELEEDLMEEFYGDPAGGAESAKSIDAWVKEWIARKEKEDPDLARKTDDDDDQPPGA